jgi:NADP-reducing hydrogenase subunit HndD
MSHTASLAPPRRMVAFQIDGQQARAPEGTTILQALRQKGIQTPTLCYLETLTPVNACRVCMVEVEGARVLVPSCARQVEAGMSIRTDTERVRHARKLVLELLASSVDISLVDAATKGWMAEYGATPERFGSPASPAGEGASEGSREVQHATPREERHAGHHPPLHGGEAETVAQPVKIDNDLYVRDYSKCILCYKCVEACGEDAQNTFAIAVAGRGFDAHIATEFTVPLTDSACVYCGNCIGVCPTGALMAKSEYDMRQAGTWEPDRQTVTQTVCPYCGVGCNLELHVQDDLIVKATSPQDHDVTHGHLCIKGRFGWEFINNRAPQTEKPSR